MTASSQPLCWQVAIPPGTCLRGVVTLRALVIVGHLQTSPPEAALDIEPLVVLAAVEDRLVAARLLRNEVERLDDAQAQLLALLVFGDGDVLDVSDGPEVVDAGARNGLLVARWPWFVGQSPFFLQLALQQQRAGADDAGRPRVGVLDDEYEVGAVLPRDPVEALFEFLLGNLPHRGQHPQAVEEARLIVGPLEGPEPVALGQCRLHLGGEVFVGEEAADCHCGGAGVGRATWLG